MEFIYAAFQTKFKFMLDESSYLPSIPAKLPQGPWLIISPHPDDETFGLGGALLLAAEQGIATDVLFLTSGDKGGDEGIAPIREQEALAAARIFGIRNVCFWRLSDRSLLPYQSIIDRLAEVIVSTKPACLFFPSPVEPHPDHRASSVIAWEALRKTGFTAEPWSYEISVQGPLNVLIDISAVVAHKREIMAIYASQMTQNHYVERIMGLNQARAWSLPLEVSHAEAFYVWPKEDRPLNAMLLGLQTYKLGMEAVPEIAPTVSVIIRTKNRIDLLRNAIVSVATQTYPDIELVVVNDGGEDVEAVLGEYATGSIRQVTYKSLQPGRGHAAAANVGLESAGGEYLIFLDDDDWFLPEHIENLAGTLANNARLGAAYSNTACVSWQNREWKTVFEYKDSFDPIKLAYENFLPIHSVLFRKSLIDSNCRFPEDLSIYEDWAFWLQLSQRGLFEHIDKPGAIYRTGEHSGVGLPGSNRDFNSEYSAFIKWAKGQWTDKQALALARSALSLKLLMNQMNETREKFTCELEENKSSLMVAEDRLKDAEDRLKIAEDKLTSIVSSKSWRYTEVLRNSARLLRALTNGTRIINGLKYLSKGDWSCLFNKARNIYYNDFPEPLVSNDFIDPLVTGNSFEPISLVSKGDSIVIVCTHHTIFVAFLIEYELVKLGFSVSIHTNQPENYDDRLHIIICPQMLNKLPRSYIAFQMEQSASMRWFDKEYINKLDNSIAILDYSIKNISFLQQQGLSYKKIFYLPISCHPNVELTQQRIGWNINSSHQKKYDVLFYGDTHNERRSEALATLAKKFNIKIINNLFGDALYNEILSSKLVVNIHYYENSLLETTRIYECLSLGIPVVSETSSDQHEYAHLNGIVMFAECGDIEGMAKAIETILGAYDDYTAKLKAVLPTLKNQFGFFFRRFLLAHDIIDFDMFCEHDESPFIIGDSPVCLGLPETIERRTGFMQKNQYGFSIFDGLRHKYAWIGCALSYKYLMHRAQAEGLPQFIICEDDVEFHDDYEQTIIKITEYLKSHVHKWHVFSGMISDAHENINVFSVSRYGDIEFIHINKTVGMVFNIYHSSIYAVIASWDPSNRDVDTNTIDRYIESKENLHIITKLPFLVGHEKENHSTLWGLKNTQCVDMIQESEELLHEKVDRFKSMVAQAADPLSPTASVQLDSHQLLLDSPVWFRVS